MVWMSEAARQRQEGPGEGKCTEWIYGGGAIAQSHWCGRDLAPDSDTLCKMHLGHKKRREVRAAEERKRWSDERAASRVAESFLQQNGIRGTANSRGEVTAHPDELLAWLKRQLSKRKSEAPSDGEVA